jgi:DNA-directed RNA polymerase subunit M/transcription elongation factor TFIIS
MKLSKILIASLIASSLSVAAQSTVKAPSKEKKTKTEKKAKAIPTEKKVNPQIEPAEKTAIQKNEPRNCPACGRG